MALWNITIRESLDYDFRNVKADSMREAISIAEDMARHGESDDSSHQALKVDKIDRFSLADDGTLDTVIKDNETGEEHRFNYQNTDYDGTYDDFVAWCIEQLESEVCDD